MQRKRINLGGSAAITAVSLFVLLGCAWLDPVFAQSDKPAAENAHLVINQIDLSHFPDIKLFVSVLNSSGKMIRGLGDKDFTVKEDEVEQSSVKVETQLPSIATALVLDTSGSMKKAIADVQQAAVTYVDNVRTEDEVLLIDFSDKVKVVQNFTTDKAPIKTAIGGIKARGNTALYDAVFEAVKSFGDKKGRKVAIVLTDGKDDDGTNKALSVKTVDQVVAAAKEINVPIFTIGLGSDVDSTVLKRIASESGGQYFPSPSSADLENLYKEIGAQLTGQYLLSYATDLSETDGSWHRVVVTAGGGLGQKQYMAPLDKSAAKAQVQPALPPAKEETKPTESVKEADKPKINVLAASRGTQILTATSQYDNTGWAARNLIDEAIGKDRGYAAGGAQPQEIVFELPKTAVASKVIVDPYTVEGESNWAKDVELSVSTTDAHSGFTKVLAVTLENKRMESQDPAYSLTEQTFPLTSPARARWVKLLLKNNYGGSYTELGEIKVLGHFVEEEGKAENLKNVLSEENGGKLLYFTGQYDNTSWAARNLVDGQLGRDHGYASKDNATAEVVFVLPEVTTVTQVAFNPFTIESPDNWVKDVEVQVSTEGPKSEYKSAGKFTLLNSQNVDPGKPLPDQVFKIEPVQAKFVKLLMLKNYGGTYMELGEFKLFAPAP
ncbi:MAG: VWA domain-containing protein [Syntrophobacteraceae bacterium]